MSEIFELEEFDKNHPHPDMAGIDSLFKFYRINLLHFEYYSDLFIDKKLYHALPKQFNDPFECKPHYKFPTGEKSQELRKHLVKAQTERGIERKTAENNISEHMKKEGNLPEEIHKKILNSFGELRICSFTAKKDNLLLWSHYADSHKGFCIELDVTKKPLNCAFKVKYTKKYPDVHYPIHPDKRAYKPALIKSRKWRYEKEYRSIFHPEGLGQLKNDGISLILNGDEIKNVYFGVDIDQNYKEKIVEFINRGPFDPTLWDANLSKSSFELEFSECCKSSA